MVRPTRSLPNVDPDGSPDAAEPATSSRAIPLLGFRVTEPDLASLPIAGITRRRMAMILGALLAAWIIVVFARQVSEASAATSRAQEMIASNATRSTEIAAMERELYHIQREPYVLQQARAYGLGGAREIPFSLAADAPALASDAPGSAAARLGAPTSMTPMERWLTLLFGSAD
jgi:hypothetical protein